MNLKTFGGPGQLQMEREGQMSLYADLKSMPNKILRLLKFPAHMTTEVNYLPTESHTSAFCTFMSICLCVAWSTMFGKQNWI